MPRAARDAAARHLLRRADPGGDGEAPRRHGQRKSRPRRHRASGGIRADGQMRDRVGARARARRMPPGRPAPAVPFARGSQRAAEDGDAFVVGRKRRRDPGDASARVNARPVHVACGFGGGPPRPPPPPLRGRGSRLCFDRLWRFGAGRARSVGRPAAAPAGQRASVVATPAAAAAAAGCGLRRAIPSSAA